MGKVVKIVLGVALIAGAAFLIATGGAGILLAGSLFISSGTILAVGASLVLGGLMGGKRLKVPDSQLGRLNVSMDVGAQRKAAFGTTAFPLDLRYHEGTGTDQEYIHYIIAHAAHKIASIDEIWFEQDQAWTAGGGVTAKYSGYLTVTTRAEGTAGNEVTISGNWGSGERLTGCAYTYIRIKRTGNTDKSESPLVSGLPSRVTVVGEGALLYDPRLDSTVTGGSGAHRADDQTTWGASYSPADSYDNPALQLLWWLLGWKIGGKLSVGCGVPPARIDLESFIEAANICDESVTLAAGGTQERYRSSGTASDSDGRMDIINTFLLSMNGTMRDNGGKLSLDILKDDLADYVLDLADDDVLEAFQWDQTGSLSETHNAVRGRFVDPSNNSLYQMVDYPEVTITSPDGIERVLSLDLGYVEEGRRAQRIAKQVLQRNQYRGSFQSVFSAKALGCDIGEIVRLTFAPLGFSNKLFRVVSKQIQMDGRVPLGLVEENAAIYAWDAEESAVVTATAPTAYDPLNSPFILADILAQLTAEAKAEIYYQAAPPPTSISIDDIWYNTTTEKWYIARAAGADAITAGEWELVTDGDIAIAQAAAVAAQADATTALADALAAQGDATTALADASTAQTTADSKIEVFYQSGTPTSNTAGDLWFKTDTQKWYIADIAGADAIIAGEWELTQDSDIGVAIVNASTAQATADGKVTTYLDEHEPYPIDLLVGDPLTDSPSLSLSFAGSFSDGDIWFTPVSKLVSRWDVESGAWDRSLADITKTVSGASDVVLNYDSAGVITTSLPKSSVYKIAAAGGTALTTGVTWAVSTKLGGAQVSADVWSGAVPSISGAGTGALAINSGLKIAQATLEITATIGGVTYPAYIMTVSKVVALAVAAPADNSFDSVNVSGQTINSSTFAQIAALTVRTLSGSTDVDLTASSLEVAPQSTSSSVASSNIQLKWQWYSTGGGVWTDVGTADSSNPDPFNYEEFPGFYDPVGGSVTSVENKTGLTGGESYDFRLMARISSGATTATFEFSGTVSAQG